MDRNHIYPRRDQAEKPSPYIKRKLMVGAALGLLGGMLLMALIIFLFSLL